MPRRLVRTLRNPDFPTLLQAYAGLLLAELGVRLVGVLPVWRVIRRQYRPGAHGVAPVAEAERLHGLVARAARRHWHPMRCLPQSLTLAWLLARRGIPVQLRFGVQRPGGELQAHAWLEADGRSIGHLDESFHPLPDDTQALQTGRGTTEGQCLRLHL